MLHGYSEKPSQFFNTAAPAEDREGLYWGMGLEREALFYLLVILPDQAFAIAGQGSAEPGWWADETTPLCRNQLESETCLKARRLPKQLLHKLFGSLRLSDIGLSRCAFDERGDPGQMLGEMVSGVAINDIQGGGSVTFSWLFWQIVTIWLLKIRICQPLEHL